MGMGDIHLRRHHGRLYPIDSMGGADRRKDIYESNLPNALRFET